MKKTRHTNFIHFENWCYQTLKNFFLVLEKKNSVYRANKKENILTKKLRIIQFPYMEIL